MTKLVRFSVGLCVLALPLTAMANGPGWPQAVPPTKIINVDKSIYQNANAWADADADATAGAQAYGGAGGSVGPITVQGAASMPDKIKFNNVPDVTTIIASPTANCRNTFGLGVGVAGLGLNGGGSTLDENCARIERSRHLHNLGQAGAAIQVMCMDDEARKALEATGVVCKLKAPEQPKNVGQ